MQQKANSPQENSAGSRQFAPRETMAGKHKSRGVKRARSDVSTFPVSNGVGKKMAVSEDGRQSKKCKLDGKTASSKMNKAVKDSSEADPGVDDVKADKVNKCGTVAPEDGGGFQISEPKRTKWKLELRPALRRILERDLEMVMVKGKRHRLPASPNILQLLDGFVQDASNRHISALDKTLSK